MVKKKVSKKVSKKSSRVKSQVKVKTARPVRRRQKSDVQQHPGGELNEIHKNIRCRNCLIVDGYPEKENVCRYCGARFSVNGG